MMVALWTWQLHLDQNQYHIKPGALCLWERRRHTIVLPGSYGCVLRLLLSGARLNAHIITQEQKILGVLQKIRYFKNFLLFSDTLQNRFQARFRKS